MGISFTDIKEIIELNKTKKGAGYSIPMFPRLNKVIGNIQQDTTTVITGTPGAGMSSFVDQNYVLSVLLQWVEIDPDERPPLKIFYFSMKTSIVRKLQQLLCTYIKLVDGLQVDVPTLNSQVGRLLDIDEDAGIQQAIEDAEVFFNDVLDSGTLEIIERPKTPTDIFNTITKFMSDKGTVENEQFVTNSSYKNLMTLVIVDSTDYLLNDYEGHGLLVGKELHEKFHRYLRTLKTQYKTSSIIMVPSSLGLVRSPKDTEPHPRHLGTYDKVADIAIGIYNPIAENNVRFYNGNTEPYKTVKGNILLRTWHVILNNVGVNAANGKIIFLPGTGYMREIDTSEEPSTLDESLNLILEESYFHN